MTDRKKTISRIPYRVAYQDTDSGGVVYYANYLGFMERGRNEYLRQVGRSIKEYQDGGTLFIVVEATLRYRAPAVLDDLLVIETWIEDGKRSSVVFGQRVLREGAGEVLVEGEIKIACINDRLRPTRLTPLITEGPRTTI